VIQGTLKHLSYPGKHANALAKMLHRKLGFLGITEPKVLKHSKGKIPVESGSIYIMDTSTPEPEEYDEDLLLENMRSGNMYVFCVGEDGIENVEIRLTDAPVPLLSVKESKRVIGGSTREFALKAPTGHLLVYDAMGTLKENALILKVDPGFYKISVFIFDFPRVEDYSFYITLSKTNAHKPNIVDEVETLEPM
jgi:hypothetical protein